MDQAKQEWAKQTKAAGGKGWPLGKLKKAKALAEKMKPDGEIDNPHALSRWAVARGAIVGKIHRAPARAE